MKFSCPKFLDTRIKTFFAIFPVRAGDEIRWLETVTIYESFVEDKWSKTCFLDNGGK